jgi:hypothetical protein
MFARQTKDRVSRVVLLTTGVLWIVVIISLWTQGGGKAALILLGCGPIAVVLVYRSFSILSKRPLLTVLCIALPICSFFYYIGPCHLWLDICCTLFSASLPLGMSAWLASRRGSDSHACWKAAFRLRSAAWTLLVFWVLISVADYVYPIRPYHGNDSGNSEIVRQPANARFAMAFSGGGYRAGLFHAGVISVLEDSGIRPQAVASVSGGSIFASFYAAGGTPDDFRTLVSSHAFNLKRQLFDAQTLVHLIAATNIWLTTPERWLRQTCWIESFWTGRRLARWR